MTFSQSMMVTVGVSKFDYKGFTFFSYSGIAVNEICRYRDMFLSLFKDGFIATFLESVTADSKSIFKSFKIW